jgi:hypothetical protein
MALSWFPNCLGPTTASGRYFDPFQTRCGDGAGILTIVMAALPSPGAVEPAKQSDNPGMKLFHTLKILIAPRIDPNPVANIDKEWHLDDSAGL